MKTFSDTARKKKKYGNCVNSVFNCKLWIDTENSSSCISQMPILHYLVSRCLEMISPAEQSAKRTWIMDLFCAFMYFLLIRLGTRPGSVFQLCPSEFLAHGSAFHLPIHKNKVGLLPVWLFFWLGLWKKLPYVSLGWPEGRLLISNSRLFPLCSEGHSSIPLLTLSVRLVSSGSSIYLLTSNDPSSVRASGSQSNYADRWTDKVLFYQLLFYMNCIYNFYI